MPKRGRSGGGKRARGGRAARPQRQARPAPGAQPVHPSEAPPTEGLLGHPAPVAEHTVLVPFLLPAPETKGLLTPEPEPAPEPAPEPLPEPEPGPEPLPGPDQPRAAAYRRRPGAEDTLTPEEWRAAGYTPPTGVAVPALMPGAPGEAPWPDRMRTLLRIPMSERPSFERTARELHPSAGRNVPRILDLTLRIGELLLASGEAAEDVEAAMLGIAHAYRLDRCEPQVTFTLIGISHQPSLVEPPITADRVVRRRTSDYTRLNAVYELVADITAEKVSVNDAYRRLALIRRNRHPYPAWLLALNTGLLAGAATFLVGGRIDDKAWLVFISAFVAAVLGDRMASTIARRGLPEFYQFVLAAMPAAASGLILSFNDLGLRGSVVITGGLFALLPGRALVAAVQDGLTGFYITAAARLLEVIYLVAGIVIGVMLILYLGVGFQAKLRPDESLVGVNYPPVQMIAALVLTLAFAMLLQTDRRSLALVTLNSGIGWASYGVLVYNAAISPIVATGVAAGLVGLFGQLMARYRNGSALPYVTAAIGPLMPGSALYLGMLSFAQGHASGGLVQITRAAAIALALAIGVNLGGEIARLFMKLPVGVERPSLAPVVPRRAAKRTRGF
ncbi:threonine/serine ThrE exporter family protein [Streptomyces sp. BE303]|uniref:threonine/serine ThrE exporter family protein n=1 Tax=Streptomyces sp. BE303 TaxID=3002528 RepID=UPI002E773D87|nr:threonine/serine exporter family protein [Streptomyces sp. BE303]MED7954543.1 threonine/serine exporter family protein [Streptomyces sp. BE303]